MIRKEPKLLAHAKLQTDPEVHVGAVVEQNVVWDTIAPYAIGAVAVVGGIMFLFTISRLAGT